MTEPIDHVAAELAPTGQMRVALNMGNRLFTRLPDGGGPPEGLTIDLSNALAARLGLAPVFETYERASHVVEALAQGRWDISFMAIDPSRSDDVSFSPGYVAVEGCFLARADCAAETAEDVGRMDLAVGVVRNSAYGLHLERTDHARRLRSFPTRPPAVAAFDAGELPILAGTRALVTAEAAERPGARVLESAFMSIPQAIGVPAQRDRAAAYVSQFIDEMRASGFVADAVRRHGLEGITLL